MKKQKKTFMICSVRNASQEDIDEITKYMGELEKMGYVVHCPHYHTNQNDRYGVNIVCTSRDAIKNSEKVFAVYDERSNGSKFDMGMSFYLGKDIEFINLEGENPREIMEEFRIKQALKEEFDLSEEIKFSWDQKGSDYMMLGMAFASGNPISLIDKNSLEMDDKKSFKNVFILLDYHNTGELPNNVTEEQRTKIDEYMKKAKERI